MLPITMLPPPVSINPALFLHSSVASIAVEPTASLPAFPAHPPPVQSPGTSPSSPKFYKSHTRDPAVTTSNIPPQNPFRPALSQSGPERWAFNPDSSLLRFCFLGRELVRRVDSAPGHLLRAIRCFRTGVMSSWNHAFDAALAVSNRR